MIANAQLRTFDCSVGVLPKSYDRVHQSRDGGTPRHFLETPELAPALERQFETSVVTERENSGGGFFTTMRVAIDVPTVVSPSVLGYATQARISGLEHGLGFVLFIKGGRLHMLEGFAWGSESTHHLDLSALEFEIYNELVQSRI
ncbi:hypothetical protein [Sphingomonas sp. S-NIH.Pt15_0812]|jgi:hypothetical protein|uniref:hypothetical protein n=1 Tax=Sphingomonas sp. S-NIH.Pt15_0812 TaxID=1920129 RepID=UPI000F7EBFF4|nr:hypothetical protein [Sphingomonas sp. S-NIH.Pt15_0812]